MRQLKTNMFRIILNLLFTSGLLHRTQEKGPDPAKESVDPHQEESSGEDQPQVHRHHLQVWSRKVPDPRREGRFHGTSQEGQEGLENSVIFSLFTIDYVYRYIVSP